MFMLTWLWREGRDRNFSLTFNCDGHFVGIMFLPGSRAKKLSQLESKPNYGSLQMYKVPPTGNISLEEFEEFAIARLKGDFT